MWTFPDHPVPRFRPWQPRVSRLVVTEPGGPGQDAPGPAHSEDIGNDEDGPESILQSALSRAPDQGISVSELMAATGMGRRWVYYRLRELSAAGRVIQTARGLWRIAPSRRQP